MQAEPGMSLHDAHELGGAVKAAIRQRISNVRGVLVHMEPYEERKPGLGTGDSV